MKKNTVSEDRAEKEEARRRKMQARIDRHTVICPHCGKKALDHMTACPHCGGELTPAGYRPSDGKRMKKIKTVCYAVGIAVAIVIAAVIIILNKR